MTSDLKLKQQNLVRIQNLVNGTLLKGEQCNEIILPSLLAKGNGHPVKKRSAHTGNLFSLRKIYQIFKSGRTV
jgi:hypothetical protein